MTLLDEYSRPGRTVDHRRPSLRRVGTGDDPVWGGRLYPSDSGPEFIATKVQRWLGDHQIKTIYIDPGSPWQNGYIESFHSRFRDECLSR